jgi:xylose isomerase
MRKLCLAYYGDDHYNHERSTNEWGRYYLNTAEDIEFIPKRQQEQLFELFRKKRIAWYKILLVTLSPDGDSLETFASEYHPLRHRIVLNEQAKADMEKVKITTKTVKFADFFDAVPQAVWGQAGVNVEVEHD